MSRRSERVPLEDGREYTQEMWGGTDAEHSFSDKRIITEQKPQQVAVRQEPRGIDTTDCQQTEYSEEVTGGSVTEG